MDADRIQAPFLADQLALDFVNTRLISAHGTIDCIDSPEKLERWLDEARTKYTAAFHNMARRPLAPALVKRAQELREWLRERLLDAKRQRRPARSTDWQPLNELLASGRRFRKVVAGAAGPTLQETIESESSEAVLLPIAEAAAELLCQTDAALIRKCGNDACILWFYDRSKSKRRRWCSMEACGNQAKVTSFRQRQRRSGARTSRRGQSHG